jgi:hypothetical protein
MSRNAGRKVLYSPGYVRGFANALAQARSDLAALNFRHACAQADLRRELDAARSDLAELRAAVLARQAAEQEVAALRRAREIARCAAVERDDRPLH